MYIRKIALVAIAVLCSAVTVAHPVAAARIPGSDHGGVPLMATLAGPVSGQTGTAQLTINPGQREVCYVIKVANLAPVTAAHIHKGGPDVNGPIVVPLFAFTTPKTGTALTVRDCVHGTPRAVLTAIVRNPSGYYVNVHTTQFPAGAIRGQLHRVS